MKLLIMGLLILGNVFLSGSVFSQIYFFGVMPDVLIAFAASIIAIEKRVNGILFAMVGGFVLDLIFGRMIGFYTLQYFLGAVAMYYFGRRTYSEFFLVPAYLAAIGIAVKEVVAMLIIIFIDQSFSFLYVVVRYVVPTMLTTGVFALLTQLFMKWLYKYKFMTRRSTTEFLDNL